MAEWASSPSVIRLRMAVALDWMPGFVGMGAL